MKGLKKLTRTLKTDISRVDDFSNPSGSTSIPLTFNKLAVITDKVLTKSNRGKTSSIFVTDTKMTRLNYKKAAVYDAGGDLKKQWFVFYSFKDPVSTTFKRFKVFKEINQENTKSGRYDIANYYVKVIDGWLEKGGSPYEEMETAGDDNKNIVYCIEQFLLFIENGKLRGNTKRKYKVELNIFKEWIKSSGLTEFKIGEIKKQHIFEFIEHIKKRNIKSGKTINHYLNDIRRFFNHYIDNYDDYIHRNPASKITRDPVQEKGNIAYTDDEFESIKKYLLANDPYLWFVCEVIYYTGLRNEAEALELRVNDFDLINNRFFVDSDVAKNKIRQSVPIYPEFAELLKSLNLSQYPKDWYLFGRKDQPGAIRIGTDNFARRFRFVKRHFGFGNDYGIYSFKATRACHLYDDGSDLRDIQTLFRHSDLYVTMKYLKSLGRVERARVYDKGRKI